MLPRLTPKVSSKHVLLSRENDGYYPRGCGYLDARISENGLYKPNQSALLPAEWPSENLIGWSHLVVICEGSWFESFNTLPSAGNGGFRSSFMAVVRLGGVVVLVLPYL